MMERNYHDEQNDVLIEQICSLEQVMLLIEDHLKVISTAAAEWAVNSKYQRGVK